MSIGTHFVLDLCEIDSVVFKDKLSKSSFDAFHVYMTESIKKNGMTLLNSISHHFSDEDGAFTSLYLLSESHISFHSWPEFNYIACDVFTCGENDIIQICEDIKHFLKPKHVKQYKHIRSYGQIANDDEPNSTRPLEHEALVCSYSSSSDTVLDAQSITTSSSSSSSSSADTLIKEGWFSETEAMWPGQKFCMQVEEVLFNGRSEFQDILVFKSSNYGKVLVLDGVIQVTERDEFSYNEMITHIPLFASTNPRKVLIIGGGDGGVLREVVKHASVTEIHMCEIDRQVIEVSKEFFSDTMSTAFDDPRVTLLIDDAARYLREEGSSQGYDVIICDSSDPTGPADVLFQSAFFSTMRAALAPGGIVCAQCECAWLHLDFIANVMHECKGIFGSVNYAYTSMPTYPSGQIGFILASADTDVVFSEPKRDVPVEMPLRYYSGPIHQAAFVLPAFAANRLTNRCV